MKHRLHDPASEKPIVSMTNKIPASGSTPPQVLISVGRPGFSIPTAQPVPKKNKPGRQSEDDRPPGGIFRIGSVGLCRDFCPVNYAKQKNLWVTASCPATPENFVLHFSERPTIIGNSLGSRLAVEYFHAGNPIRTSREENHRRTGLPRSPCPLTPQIRSRRSAVASRSDLGSESPSSSECWP